MNSFIASYLNSRLSSYKPNIMQSAEDKFVFIHKNFSESIEGATLESVKTQLQQIILNQLSDDLKTTIAIPSIDRLFDMLNS